MEARGVQSQRLNMTYQGTNTPTEFHATNKVGLLTESLPSIIASLNITITRLVNFKVGE